MQNAFPDPSPWSPAWVLRLGRYLQVYRDGGLGPGYYHKSPANSHASLACPEGKSGHLGSARGPADRDNRHRDDPEAQAGRQFQEPGHKSRFALVIGLRTRKAGASGWFQQGRGALGSVPSDPSKRNRAMAGPGWGGMGPDSAPRGQVNLEVPKGMSRRPKPGSSINP